jgi:hypothetical protein
MDNMLTLTGSTVEYTFWQLDGPSMDSSTNLKYKNLVYWADFTFSKTRVQYERKIYTLLDVFGDYGGVTWVIQTFLAFILGSYSSHSFDTKMISNMFEAKTTDSSMFGPKWGIKAKRRM